MSINQFILRTPKILTMCVLALFFASCTKKPNTTAKKLTLTFNTNGGKSIESQSIEKDKTATKPKDPTKENFVFDDWFTDKDSTKAFSFNTLITSDITLYAKWIQAEYSISFNTNSESSITDIKVLSGDTATKPTNPTKENFVFKGWFTDTALTTAFSFDNLITSDITLYAKWIQAEYSVSFNTNSESRITDIKVLSGNEVTKPTNPTKAGFIFDDWFTDNNTFKNAFNFSTTITQNTTIYAKWLEAFTITFNTNGGGGIESKTIEKGKTATQPTDPKKLVSVFDGWFTDIDLTIPFNFNTPITQNTTIYAKWNQGGYSVSFNTNGGSSITDITVLPGNKAREPEDPKKANLPFGGWFTDADLTMPFSFETPITLKITLYAKWNRAEYSVSFNTNGGSSITDIKVLSGNEVTKPTNPKKTGFVFDSWFTDSTLTTPFNFNTPITSNITLYAKWGVNIPDDAFRAELKKRVPNAFNNDILDPEHSDVKSLTVLHLTVNNFPDKPRQDIVNLEGIQHFTELTYLNVASNQLTSLDVSSNTKLIKLDCNSNQLTSLNLSENTKLTELDCEQNELTSLSLSTNTELTKLDCRKNKLTSLNISTNTKLTELNCRNNQLTSLDLSKNIKLITLDCENNQLTSLNLLENIKLESLLCKENQLTSLNLSTNIELKRLFCSSNQLESLNLSKNTELTNLDCSNNKLTSLNLSTNIKLRVFNCFNNKLTSLDVSKNTNLRFLDCKSNLLTSLDMRSNKVLSNLSIHFADSDLLVYGNPDLSEIFAHKDIICHTGIKDVFNANKATLVMKIKAYNDSGTQTNDYDETDYRYECP